jgi:putative hydrolase of the HAD superfamily
LSAHELEPAGGVASHIVREDAEKVRSAGAEAPRENRRVPLRAVFLDFYGTLARATRWVSIDEILAEHGYELPDTLRQRWWSGDLDGIEHVEHSRTRDHYVAWQQERMLGMLAESDVHPGEYEVLLDKLRAGTSTRVLEAYPETADTLRALRARGLRLVVCSNWDWDLEPAVEEAGLTELLDVLVSSAWAGARKPHPRIFEHTLEKADVARDEVLFVGDTWGPDVEGPLAAGMTAAYLEREGHWPDPTAPADSACRDGVAVISDLAAVLALV